MPAFKTGTDFGDRQDAAAKAKLAMLQKYRAKAEDPEAAKRREALARARAEREERRELAEQIRRERVAAEREAAREAERAAAEKAKREAEAARLAAAERAAQKAAEQRAALDLFNAMRKARRSKG